MKLFIALFALFFIALAAAKLDPNLFMSLSQEQAAKYMKEAGADKYIDFTKYPQVIGSDLPESFDGRTHWDGCIHPVQNQGRCASCWAFAAAGTLSDRFCTFSNGSVNVVLSPQTLTSCEWQSGGCTVGSPPNFAWRYMQLYGIVNISCAPYRAGNGENPSCKNSLICDPKTVQYYHAANYEHVGSVLNPTAHIDTIMRAVMKGPVDVTFNVWGDFGSYRGGVYKHKSGSYHGLHSVKVIGWGTDPKEGDYWIAQNSWGPTWGPLKGYFHIAKGVNECFIETLVYTGAPDLKPFGM